jgi:hypothetical protein
MIELPCPESCTYLIQARASSLEREKELRQKENLLGSRDAGLNERAFVALDRIQSTLVDAQRGIGPIAFHDLDDVSTLEAIENTIRNLETEGTGLIYEHRAASARIGDLSWRIRERLDEIAKEAPPEMRPRRSEILKALAFLRDSVNAHISRAAGDPEAARSFVRFVTLFYPWPREATGPMII